MITSMHIKNFKCFKDFRIELGKFNVLIGPNDSGKTALLQAVQLACILGSRPGSSLVRDGIRGIDFHLGTAAVWRHQTTGVLSIIAEAKPEAEGFPDQAKLVLLSGEVAKSKPGRSFLSYVGSDLDSQLDPKRAKEWFADAIGPAAYYRFEPAALRKPSKLADEMERNGLGLAAFLDHLNRLDSDAYKALGDRFRERFPHYQAPAIEVIGKKPDKRLTVAFPTARSESLTLSAESVSDGVMMSLAFLTLAFQPSPAKLLLIEEPENSVHHASLKDIIGTLKHLNDEKSVQVILTTHSPYLLDFVEMDEVRVFTKDDEGAVHAQKLSDLDGADEISDMFATGEKWSMLSEEHGI